MSTPKEIRHDWRRTEKRGKWACSLCDVWTSNLPLDKDDVCPKRDRRKGVQERRGAEKL